MTGKDFSGPTPVIRARTPPNLAQLSSQAGPSPGMDDAVSLGKVSHNLKE